MKVKIKNKSDSNQKVRFVPAASTAKVEIPTPSVNPAMDITEDGSLYFCLKPTFVQNISCAAATSHMVVDDHSVFEPRMHWNVIINEEVLVLDASTSEGLGVSLANFLTGLHEDFLSAIGLSVWGASAPTAYFYNMSSRNLHISLIPMNEFTSATFQLDSENQSGYVLEDGSLHFCLSPGVANT